jgi:hypothetical protein
MEAAENLKLKKKWRQMLISSCAITILNHLYYILQNLLAFIAGYTHIFKAVHVIFNENVQK